MKLVTGLTLVSIVYGRDLVLQDQCLSVNLDEFNCSENQQLFVLLAKCADEELVDIPMDLCVDDSDNTDVDENAVVTTIENSKASDSFLTPRNGGQELARTWVDDVHEYCRDERNNCKKKRDWGFRVVDRLAKFQEAMDNRLKRESSEHYNEYMTKVNERCFVRTKHCEKEIKQVGDVEIPAYDNFWKVNCVECFVTAMRVVVVHAGDTNLAGMNGSNCLGKFCEELKRTEEQLMKVESGQVKKGERNNALSADIRHFAKWRQERKNNNKPRN